MRRLFLAALLMMAPLPTLAAVRGDYTVAVGGLVAFEAQVTLMVDEDHYRIALEAAPQGMMHYLIPWSLSAEVEGRHDAGGWAARPVHYRSVSSWRGKERSVRIDYDESGLVQEVQAIPPLRDDEFEAVPAYLIPGSVDLMTGVFEVLLRLDAGAICQAAVPVYDGRRRFEVSFEALGKHVLAKNSLSFFSGEATACRITSRVLAGRRKEDGNLQQAEAKSREGGVPITAYAAPLSTTGHNMPVRINFDSAMGLVVIHLKSLEEVAPATLVPWHVSGIAP